MAEITQEDAEPLVNQIQNAHRISVAFYQRILPIFDSVANNFGCSNFIHWGPLNTDRVCTKKTRPSSKWAWDFVSLFTSSHIYWKTSGDKSSIHDLGLSFALITDDNFSKDNLKALNVKGVPDPVSLPFGDAYVGVYAFKPIKSSKESFETLWDASGEIDDENINTGEWEDVGGGLKGMGFTFPLADIFMDANTVTKKLEQYIEK